MEREKQKKRKAEDKRQRRLERKANEGKEPPVSDDEVENDLGEGAQSEIKDETGDDLSNEDDG